MYRESQKKLYDLEAEGRALIFAPSNPPKMGTYTMKREVEQQLYDLGLSDYAALKDKLAQFLNDSQSH